MHQLLVCQRVRVEALHLEAAEEALHLEEAEEEVTVAGQAGKMEFEFPSLLVVREKLVDVVVVIQGQNVVVVIQT